jgi:small GTP-binding protein
MRDSGRHPIIKKKICLFGAFGVGKTSLIGRFVHNVFSPKYLSTVGVKVDKKVLSLGPGLDITMMVWDFEGRSDYVSMADGYLLGMSGFFLVADGTRPDTLEDALAVQRSFSGLFSEVPSVLLLNKSDLRDRWLAKDDDCAEFAASGIEVMRTSAKDGAGVEESFAALGRRMLSGDRR